jgi:hypothetical protein
MNQNMQPADFYLCYDWWVNNMMAEAELPVTHQEALVHLK